jgi:hypothetical protein
MSNDHFVAVGLLTRRDLDVLGSGFRRAYPLDQTAKFSDLLSLIDEAIDRRWITEGLPIKTGAAA